MKKKYAHIAIMLAALPFFAYAEEVKPVVASSTLTATSSAPLVTFTLCSQEAIEERDTAIASSRLTYNTSMANALLERKNKEKAAVAISDEDERKELIKISVETYKTKTKLAQNTLTQARKEAWQTFENAIKECRKLEQESPLATSSEMIQKHAEEEKTITEVLKEKIVTLKSLFN